MIKSEMSSKILACLVTFAVGLRVGMIQSVVTPSAAKSMTGRARQFPFVSLVLAATVVREVYRLIPAWAKRKPKTTSKDPDDMSSFASICLKLQSLFNVASEKLKSTLPPANTRASLYAVVQLFTQVKQQQAEQRDKTYDEAGTIVDPKQVLQTYAQYFEFADWAYDEFSEDEKEQSLQERLATCNYELLRHDQTALPGRVAHYVAVSKEENKVLFGIKGSSNFEDLMTDCCGLALSYTLSAPFVPGGCTEIRAHEGIYISSRRLAKDLEPFVKYLVIPNGYNLVITGHSLGAGASAMLGLLLRSRFPELQTKSRLQVLAFASPPILDYNTALACVPFTTTIVNNADVIPRSSLHNLAIMLEFMKIVNSKMEEEGMLPDSFKSVAAFMRFVSGGRDGKMIMSAEEIPKAMAECVEKLDARDPDFLYVPGRVIHMFDLWSKKDYEEAEKEVEMEADDVVEPEEKPVKTAERVYEGNGTSKVLKVIEVDERMVLDHLSEGYRGSIRSLLSS